MVKVTIQTGCPGSLHMGKKAVRENYRDQAALRKVKAMIQIACPVCLRMGTKAVRKAYPVDIHLMTNVTV